MSKPTKHMLDFMDKVLNGIGPREAGSKAERETADLVSEYYSDGCDEVITEPFTVHPRAFLGFIPFVVLAYWVSTFFYWYTPIAALLIMSLAVFAFIQQLILSKPFLDKLYPSAESQNVSGIIKPSGEVRRRVIFNAHTDAAYEFTIWYLFNKYNVIFMISGILAIFLMFIAALLKVGFDFAGIQAEGFLNVMGYICLGLIPMSVPFMFFVSKDIVPGASDDLSGVATMMGVLENLKEMKSKGEAPKHTEIILLATGSEEAGLRGSMAYVAKNAEKLREVETFNVSLESMENPETLQVVTHELFKAHHSPKLIGMLKDIAKRNDWTLDDAMIPFGGTDAATFTQLGVHSTCLLGLPTKTWPTNYHTRRDTMEHVKPEGLDRGVDFCIELIKDLDKEISS